MADAVTKFGQAIAGALEQCVFQMEGG